jgi:hypothetical protein
MAATAAARVTYFFESLHATRHAESAARKMAREKMPGRSRT